MHGTASKHTVYQSDDDDDHHHDHGHDDHGHDSDCCPLSDCLLISRRIAVSVRAPQDGLPTPKVEIEVRGGRHRARLLV